MDTLKINEETKLKLDAYVDNTDGEISGYGKTVIDKDGECTLVDVIILDQTCTSGSTELDDDAQAKFLFELEKKKDSPENWNVWWHSHADMGVFWSSTDVNNIQERAHQMDFLISLVVNKKGESKCRLDNFPEDKSPWGLSSMLTYDDLDVEVEYAPAKQKQIDKLKAKMEELELQVEYIENGGELKEAVEDICKAEIKKKVKAHTYGGGKKAQRIGFSSNDTEQDDDFVNRMNEMKYANRYIENAYGQRASEDSPSGLILYQKDLTPEEAVEYSLEGYTVVDNFGHPLNHNELEWELEYADFEIDNKLHAK